jgi:pSer/pThr/pTyr-binding forkhead associated (FHA) protein
MAPELILTYMSGPRDGEEVRPIISGDPPDVTLGRSEACAVRVEHDTNVSRQHAKLCWRDGNWWLVDLRSTNGTYLGEFRQAKKIDSPVAIVPGQIFRIGDTRFRLQDVSGFSLDQASGKNAAEPEA